MEKLNKIKQRIDQGAKTIGEAVDFKKLKSSISEKSKILEGDKTVVK